jgi:hypothetical protein
MKSLTNNLMTGLIAGCLAPPAAFIIFCFFAFPDDSLKEIFLSYSRRNVLTHVISLSVIINLPMFFIFLGKNRDRAARGVIGATFLYAFLILILILKLN